MNQKRAVGGTMMVLLGLIALWGFVTGESGAFSSLYRRGRLILGIVIVAIGVLVLFGYGD